MNPELDLLLERVVPISRQLVWQVWTEPQHLVHWFTPKPWQTVDCRIDLRPGGEFFARMKSPEGQEFDNLGCYLAVVPQERLIWTDCLAPGFRPAGNPDFGPEEKGFFTAVITLAEVPQGTRYRALAMHKNPANRKKHEEMGFHQGWATVLDQLVAYMQGLG